ncbi:MAG: hypothetical protein HN780_24545, partial [Gemmatimonadetes bacterium]|nr:hypothetical protein [Gemmatimonadota bacterium]
AQRDLLDELAVGRKSLYQQRILAPGMAVGAAQFTANARLRPEINVDIFTTGTEAYHAYRIEPPEVVVDIAKRPPDE